MLSFVIEYDGQNSPSPGSWHTGSQGFARQTGLAPPGTVGSRRMITLWTAVAVTPSASTAVSWMLRSTQSLTARPATDQVTVGRTVSAPEIAIASGEVQVTVTGGRRSFPRPR